LEKDAPDFRRAQPVGNIARCQYSADCIMSNFALEFLAATR